MGNRLKTLTMACALVFAGSAQATGLPGQGTWQTTLQARDLDGNGVTDAFYDTVLDITWLRMANGNGLMGWDSAKTWSETLLVGGYGGWRLPAMIDTNAPGCDYSNRGGTDCGYNVLTKSGNLTQYEASQTVYSEMAHLFHVTLGNKAYCDPALSTIGSCVAQAGWGLTNTGDFESLIPDPYWSGLEYAQDLSLAWTFGFYGGNQLNDFKPLGTRAMAVHPGDVGMVPEPATYALMLAGISVAGLIARRRNQQRDSL